MLLACEAENELVGVDQIRQVEQLDEDHETLHRVELDDQSRHAHERLLLVQKLRNVLGPDQQVLRQLRKVKLQVIRQALVHRPLRKVRFQVLLELTNPAQVVRQEVVLVVAIGYSYAPSTLGLVVLGNLQFEIPFNELES